MTLTIAVIAEVFAPVRPSVGAVGTIVLVFDKSALERASFCESEPTLAIFHVLDKATYVAITSRKCQLTRTMHEPMLPLSIVHRAILLVELAIAVFAAVLPRATIEVGSAVPGHQTSPAHLVPTPFTDVGICGVHL